MNTQGDNNYRAEQARIRDKMEQLARELEISQAAEREAAEKERQAQQQKWDEERAAWAKTMEDLAEMEKRPDWPQLRAELRAKLTAKGVI